MILMFSSIYCNNKTLQDTNNGLGLGIGKGRGGGVGGDGGESTCANNERKTMILKNT